MTRSTAPGSRNPGGWRKNAARRAASGCAARSPTPARSLVLHSWIGPDIAKVADQVGEQADQREDEQRAEHHGVITPDHRLVREQPEAVEREQGLDQQRATEERADERRREAGHDRDQRVP